MFGDEADEYTPADDGPEAEFYRQEAERDKRWQELREKAVSELIHSLRPWHSRLPVFAWRHVKKFGLKRWH